MEVAAFLELHKRHKTKSCCVYFLRQDKNIVYIGSTKDPYSRVYNHTRTEKDFNDVSIMMINDEKEMVKAEYRLIAEHKPKYNKHIPKIEDINKHKPKQVKLIDNVHDMLNKIVEQRKKKGELGVNKQVVVNQLIMAAYKKECK